MNYFKEIRFDEKKTLITQMEDIWKIIQQNILNQNTKILILVGTSLSGRTTLFRYLCGDQLIYEKNNQKYELKFTSKSVDCNNSFDYFLDKKSNHFILDFHQILQEDSKENFIWEELYLRLIKNYQIKFMYILKQSLNEIEERGTAIQQFIKQYLGGNIENLILILNFYNEELTNQELTENVREQFQEIYDSTNYQSFVFKRIKQQEMLQKQFSNEKRDQIWQCVIKQHPLHVIVDKFTLNQNMVSVLNQIFTNPFKQILSKINQSCNQMVDILNLNELENLQKLINTLQKEAKLYHTNHKFWIESFPQLTVEISNIFKQQDCDFNFQFTQLQLVFESFSNIICKSNIFVEMGTIVINISQTLIQSIDAKIKILNKNLAVGEDTLANQQKYQQHKQEFIQKQNQQLFTQSTQKHNLKNQDLSRNCQTKKSNEKREYKNKEELIKDQKELNSKQNSQLEWIELQLNEVKEKKNVQKIKYILDEMEELKNMMKQNTELQNELYELYELYRNIACYIF